MARLKNEFTYDNYDKLKADVNETSFNEISLADWVMSWD